MRILRRSGVLEECDFNKILLRVQGQTEGLNMNFIDPSLIAQKAIAGITDGITSKQLDRLCAEVAHGLTKNHPDYNLLAGRIAITSLYRETCPTFSEAMTQLYIGGMLSKQTYQNIVENKDLLNNAIIWKRDSTIDYFGFRTLENSYLMKDAKENIVETPQYLYMRVAVGLWQDNIVKVLETYRALSTKEFTHATPTLFNSGTNKAQMASCFLLPMEDDSIEGIFSTLKDCAHISKHAGGIGISASNIRSNGSRIYNTNGTSNGLIPFLKVFNETARCVDQAGRRKGSFAVYLEPWHADIFEFLPLKKNHGKEEMRARDLFLALWVPDLFMKRVELNAEWTLMDPNKCKNLDELFGDAFEEQYCEYERQGLGEKTIKARDLWNLICETQTETGVPYIAYKDAINIKNNQKNLGTIKCSNLCIEIVEYSSPEEVATCNLASIGLNVCVTEDKQFDFQKLFDITYQITENLNQVIDISFYPLEKAKVSNLRHRPIGIGVQALADTFAMMHIPFESIEAKELNKKIFETIYFAALTCSNDLAAISGAYESFQGSPASKGLLQYDLWDKSESLSGMWNFALLKYKIKQFGLRNSLLVALMPTASSSQILGNNECFEPFTSNLYSRRVLSGEFIIINKYLITDLIELNIWNKQIKSKLIANKGSVQNIDEIPQKLKDVYKTVWEIKQKALIELAADRAPFIDQTQSMNLFIQDCNTSKLTSAHFYSWKLGLKTGSYYIRTKAAVDAIVGLGADITEEGELKVNQELNLPKDNFCSLDNHDCEACSA